MIYLRSLPLNVFLKSAACPSAEELLAFAKSLLPFRHNRAVVTHLQECDFCRAELQLLERHPSKHEAVPVGEMPHSLRVLAESILGNPRTTLPPRLLEPARVINH
jgi:hypothetical protein